MRAVLLVGILLLGILIGLSAPLPQDQERHRDDGKKCDNSFERPPADRCACEHAEMCDPNDPADKEKHSHMTSKCQWYCHEDQCTCANACSS